MKAGKNARIFLTGLAMGAADVVPGVSGGTIAFVAGIYQELVDTLKSFHPRLLLILKSQGIKAFWQAINGTFLASLGLGIATSIVTLAHAIIYLLTNYPIIVWSFFFGLIAGSAYLIGTQIKNLKPIYLLAMIVGVGIAYQITELSPTQLDPSALTIFISGIISICAMILPGISGSFILLLLGMYTHIIGAIKSMNFGVIVIFASGCAIGLISFSHVLSWMFKNFYSFTLALLTGFMLGSLNKVWPWKLDLEFLINRHGEKVPVVQKNVFPFAFEQATGQSPYIIGSVIAVLLGLVLIFGLEKLSKKYSSIQALSVE